jgi:hypothetical protein
VAEDLLETHQMAVVAVALGTATVTAGAALADEQLDKASRTALRDKGIVVESDQLTLDLAQSTAACSIPAGPSRKPSCAKIYEETGLNGLRLSAQLVTEDKPHPLAGKPRSTTFFVIDAPSETPRWLGELSPQR